MRKQPKPPKKKKEKWVDDGHTIVDMNVEGMRGYRKDIGEPQNGNSRKSTFRDRWKTFWTAFLHALPAALLALAAFTLAAVLVWLWLH